MKAVFFLMMGLASISLAHENESFTVTGSGHYCYQEFEAARENALNEMSQKASDQCEDEKARLVSEISESGEGCTITLSAEYTCEY